ncbi:hypothetical protein [Streptomyces hypolithicus]
MTAGSTRRHRAGACHALAMLVALTGTSGCDGSEITPSNSPAPHRTTPAEVCASLISYWVEEALKDSKWAGLDWEQKGLSNEQYELHEKILVAARAEQNTRGRAAALRLAERESRARCEAANGATGSSENWRPPQ